MGIIQTKPDTFEIEDLRDVVDGPLFEAALCTEHAIALLELIYNDIIADIPNEVQNRLDISSCMLRRLLLKTGNLLTATSDYLYPHCDNKESAKE